MRSLLRTSFSGTGRSEQHDRARRRDAEAIRFVGPFQRQHHAGLDQTLLSIHSCNARPASRRQDLAPQPLQQTDFRRRERRDAFEEHDPIARDETAVYERAAADFAGGQQRERPANARCDETTLQLRQQRAADAAITPSWSDGDPENPGTLARGRAHDGRHELVPGLRDQRGLAAAHRCDDLGQRNHGVGIGVVRLFEQADGRVEVVVVEVPDPPHHGIPREAKSVIPSYEAGPAAASVTCLGVFYGVLWNLPRFTIRRSALRASVLAPGRSGDGCGAAPTMTPPSPPSSVRSIPESR
jgi:hypothetical protein